MYLASADNKARFALGCFGKRNLVVFGVNPSTATDVDYDRTIRRVEAYSRAHGFDGWLMFNLYPQRATDPDDLDAECNLALRSENTTAIAKILRNLDDFTLCAAWGGLIERRNYLYSCLAEIADVVGTDAWHCIGESTKNGHPRHPLYVRKAASLNNFLIEEYQQQIRLGHM